MDQSRILRIVGVGVIALVAVLALSWGGHRVVKQVVRMQREGAERRAQLRQEREEERARQAQVRRQEAARKMPLVTLDPPANEGGINVATVAPLTANPKSTGGLSVVTLGDAGKPPVSMQPAATIAAPARSGGLSVVTLDDSRKMASPALAPVEGLRSNAGADLSSLKVEALRPAASSPRIATAPLVAMNDAASRELLIPTATIAAPTTRPATGLSVATLDGIARELPPALEARRSAEYRPVPQADDGMRIVSGFDCSATLAVERVAETHFKVRFTGKRGSLDNYFLFRLEGVEGRTVRIDFEEAPIWKWWSLNPVYSYVADLDDPENFRSVALDSPADPVAAHNGPLLPDTRGETWHFMPDVWSVSDPRKRPGTGTLSMVHSFEKDSVYIGLKVPYTPGLNERLMASLEDNPRATVYEIGRSPQGRPLQLVKIGGDDEADKTRPCILVYGREHGTEQDSSWVVEGMIRFLLSDDEEAARLRDNFTFLLMPIMDPDGAAMSFYDRISYSFKRRDPSPEALAYAEWFEQWIDAGKRLDVAINSHNMESAEMEHLLCYFADPSRIEACRDLHEAILEQFKDADEYRVKEEIDSGYMTNRLAGWLAYSFAPLPMLYEVNSQEKNRHLSLHETRGLGWRLVLATSSYLHSKEAKSTLAFGDRVRLIRAERLAQAGRGKNAIETGSIIGFTAWNVMQEDKNKKGLGN